MTPPKAYGPKRVAPEHFTHLGATGSVRQPKALAHARLAARPLDYDVSTAPLMPLPPHHNLQAPYSSLNGAQNMCLAQDICLVLGTAC